MKKIIAKLSLVVASALALVAATPPLSGIFIEAESMDSLGGWVLDQQSMVQMGSPYIMAHGMGVPVKMPLQLLLQKMEVLTICGYAPKTGLACGAGLSLQVDSRSMSMAILSRPLWAQKRLIGIGRVVEK